MIRSFDSPIGVDQAAQRGGVATQLRLKSINSATPHLEVIPYPRSIFAVSGTLLNLRCLRIELRDEPMVSKPDALHRLQVRIRIEVVCHVVAWNSLRDC